MMKKINFVFLAIFSLTNIFLQTVQGQNEQSGLIYSFPERIRLADGHFAEAEKGMVLVPLNRTVHNTSKIAIEYFRFKAKTAEARKNPPVFRLHGGPGFSGLAKRLENPLYFEEQIAPFLEVADFVVVGQRGIGTSLPNTVCDDIAMPPLDAPVSEFEKAVQAASQKCKQYWENQHLDLKAFNIIEAAADVNDVRQVLGYEKITLWGGSFGSHWAMAVMRFHSGIVARALLRGMEGPNHTYDIPSYVLNSLKRMAAAADNAPELTPYIPEGGLIQALETVILRIEENPVVLAIDPSKPDEKVTVNAELIRRVALGYSGRVSSREGMATWPSDVLNLYHGNYESFARAARYFLEDNTIPTASFFMLDCASGITPDRYTQIINDPAQAILGDINAEYHMACPVWDTDLGDGFRQNFETEIPTLIVHGSWDVSTPLENAEELAPFFKKSHMVVVEGGSHGALLEALRESSTFMKQVKAFLASGTLEGLPDTVKLAPVSWVVPEQMEVDKEE